VDKRKVISAYRQGIITIQECAQILGIDSMQILSLLSDSQLADSSRIIQKRPMHG
jgi:predicted HTH domain antitoxin